MPKCLGGRESAKCEGWCMQSNRCAVLAQHGVTLHNTPCAATVCASSPRQRGGAAFIMLGWFHHKMLQLEAVRWVSLIYIAPYMLLLLLRLLLRAGGPDHPADQEHQAAHAHRELAHGHSHRGRHGGHHGHGAWHRALQMRMYGWAYGRGCGLLGYDLVFWERV